MHLTSVVLAIASLATSGLAAQCNADNCLRAAIGTAKGLQSIRLASCTSFLQCTVTPSATYTYDSLAPLNTSVPGSATVPRTSCPTSIPKHASACYSSSYAVDHYISACSCGGVSATTHTLPPTVTLPTRSTHIRLIIEGAPDIPPSYVGYGAVGRSDGDPNFGIQLISSPVGLEPWGAGSFSFSGNESADPSFGLEIQHRSGYGPGEGGTGDAVWAYTETCGQTGGCGRVKCVRVDGQGGEKYAQCVGARDGWTQMVLCEPDEERGWSWRFLAMVRPGARGFERCTAVRLRIDQLDKDPWAFGKVRRGLGTWRGQPLFTKDG